LLTADGPAGDALVGPLQRNGLTVTLSRDPGQAMARLNDFVLVVLDARDESTLALICRRINDETGSRHPPILAVAHSRDVESRVNLLEAGADDVLALPVDFAELDALVEALMLRAPTMAMVPAADPEGDTPAPRPVPTGPGRVVAFTAAKGGSGTTTLAVNTAVVLAEMAPRSVAIADLDMYHGQVSSHLDIYARNSTAQMAHEDFHSQPAEVVNESGKQHSSGLMVFGGPYRPDEAYDLSGHDLSTLIDVLRNAYGTVIVDVGSTLDLRSLSVLAAADTIVLPITPDIPSLRLVHAALQVMSDAGPLPDKAIFVLNQVYPRPTISAEQIEEHLGIHVSLEIPHDGENFLRAVNEGQPLVSLARRTVAAGAIKRLAENTTETRLDDEVASPARKGRLRTFLGMP
jgi:pilus assembly protein CpaE